ncbi:MAG: ROK family protein, partial [Clostridia bacterium]|nr:ROK family protein [Clostridia bacterium]
MHYIGIDIGGMSIKCGVVTEDGVLLGKQSVVTPTGDYILAVKAIAELCKKTAQAYNIAWEDIAAIGVGIPGTVHEGIVSFASNLSWYGVPFDKALELEIQKPVFSGNDANCALLAEWRFGKGKGIGNVAMITLGT